MQTCYEALHIDRLSLPNIYFSQTVELAAERQIDSLPNESKLKGLLFQLLSPQCKRPKKWLCGTLNLTVVTFSSQKEIQEYLKVEEKFNN